MFTTDASRRIFESAFGARAAQLQASNLRVRSHAGACPPPAQRTAADGGPLKPGFGLSGDVHWLSKTQQHTLADALKSFKQGTSRRLIDDADHFWQKRYYDFNIRNYPQFVEKPRYIHRNPVKQGYAIVRRTGSGAAFATMQLALKDV
jgi:hypothetical protein